MNFTIAINAGKYGGFYFRNGYTIRLCLGWLAITYMPFDIDNLLIESLDVYKRSKKGIKEHCLEILSESIAKEEKEKGVITKATQ